MSYTPTPKQQEVIDADDPVLLVLGGAGTGKTTTAAAAVRAGLERLDAVGGIDGRARRPLPRALFLSFSRSSVAQILDRTAGVLGPYAGRVEITTFHSFAWRLVRRWGAVIDLAEPTLASSAEAKLFNVPGRLLYDDLLPRAIELCAVPAIREQLQRRWSIVVSDEFQDTDDRQFELLTKIRGKGRLLLLGDPNQCIYSTLPGVKGVGPERLAAAMALEGSRQIDLPDASHRDPSGVLPAAAAAIRRREFDHEAVTTALESGRLQVRTQLPLDEESDAVAAVVQQLLGEGHSVGVFSHHIDATTALSDELLGRAVDHETIGLSESLGAALDVQHAMVEYALGATTWTAVLQRLAIFITSAVRGAQVPKLAWMLLGQQQLPAALETRLEELRRNLAGLSVDEALVAAQRALEAIGYSSGAKFWEQASRLLRPLTVSSMRRGATQDESLELLEAAVADRRASVLTSASGEPTAPVQLMGLYQTKGREADATVVVLRSTDWFGHESREPFEVGSRLLYVVLTRARHKTVVLLFGDRPPALVAPLVRLTTP